ncbi:hypothetical protein D5F11_021640 [Siminovitchia terrae]|uniref:Uncharacterized protein n=1 Tax=Siminovitchia terrae TaxID=1914933 RepID=A0A429X2G6_SIMTE|nr:hypothetical protein [Siminovitchia terrae]RST57666.1 hypothetical protein D5F11_021640 [Siminovitchia terrae]
MSEYTVVIERKPLRKTFTKIGLHMFQFTKDFTRIRYQKKDKKCHLCKEDFFNNERISLAFVKGMKNHLLCEKCAKKLIEKGVSYIDKSKT